MSIENKDIATRSVGTGESPQQEKVPQGGWSQGLPQSSMILPKESQIITFGDRVTYTFTMGKEVGSIHYDMGRGEIFYRGHNVHNLDLENWQVDMLTKFAKILNGDPQYQRFVDSYSMTLGKVLNRQKNQPDS